MTDVSPGGRRRAPSPSRPEVDPFAAQPFSSHRRIVASSHRRIVASSHRRARCRWRGRVDRRGLHRGRPDTGVEGGSVQPLALAMILRKVTQWPQLEALLAFVREVIEGDTATSMMGRACATSTMFARSFVSGSSPAQPQRPAGYVGRSSPAQPTPRRHPVGPRRPRRPTRRAAPGGPPRASRDGLISRVAINSANRSTRRRSPPRQVAWSSPAASQSAAVRPNLSSAVAELASP